MKELTEEDIQDIRNNPDKVNWENISQCQKLSEVFIREFKDKVCWIYISGFQKLSEEFIREFKDKVDWIYISGFQKLSEEFIREFKDKVDWIYISYKQKLSEDFIIEFQDKVRWNYISIHQKLSEDFIREFQDKVDWYYISKYQKLSEKFVIEFQDKIDWNYISQYQKLSKAFMKEFNIEEPQDSFMYKDKEWKRDYILKNTNYEVIDDKVIAYKSCRYDGYSKFNFQYHYEVGKEYEAHADFNCKNENSFGLSAWTKEKALEYCSEKIFKVSIDLDDLACIVYNGKKIRAAKIKILEEIK
jgi:intein-encoded DNA endonuclease-like protein